MTLKFVLLIWKAINFDCYLDRQMSISSSVNERLKNFQPPYRIAFYLFPTARVFLAQY